MANDELRSSTLRRVSLRLLPLLFLLFIASFLGVAAGFALIGLGGSAAWTLGGLFTVAIAINAFLPAFWRVPSAMFTGRVAAAAIALINSIGNLGGYLGPTLIGNAKESTGSHDA